MIVLMFNFLMVLPFSKDIMRCWKGLIKVGAADGISILCIYKFVMMWWGPFNCMDGIRWRLKLLINQCNNSLRSSRRSCRLQVILQVCLWGVQSERFTRVGMLLYSPATASHFRPDSPADDPAKK